MDERTARSILQTQAEIKRLLPNVRIGVVTDDSPVSVSLGDGTAFTDVAYVLPVEVDDRVLCLKTSGDLIIIGPFAFAGGGGTTYTAGDGLTLTGTDFDVNTGAGLGISSDAVAVTDAELLALIGVTSAANKLFYFTGSGTGAVTDLTAFARTILDDADAATVRTTIGAQQSDAELSALAGLTSAADKGIQFTGSGTAGTYDLTAFAKTFLDDADAATVRATLGLVIGTNVQAYDAELAALAGVTSAADRVPYFTGSGTAAVTTLTSLARTILSRSSTSDIRSDIGAIIGTDVQAYDADLAAIAGLTSAANKGIQFTGSGTAATYDLTTAGKALLDDADASAQLTTLGVTAFIKTLLDDADAATALATLGAQPLDADLTAIAALTTATFGRSLLAETSAANARTTLDVPSNAEAILDSLVDAKGDLIYGTADNAVARLARGADGEVLIADSAAGLIWGPRDVAATASRVFVVRVATKANGALATAFENGDTIDGKTLVTGDRILLKDQSTGSQNGIYVVQASGSPVRATDADTSGEFGGGALIVVQEGDANGDTLWMVSNNGAVTLGTTALTFRPVGAIAKFAEVATSQTTTSITAADLATVGPSVEMYLQPDDLVDVRVAVSLNNSGANNSDVFLTPSVGGSERVLRRNGTGGPEAFYSVPGSRAGANIGPMAAGSLSFRGRDLVGSTAQYVTFKLQYATSAGTGTFSERRLTVDVTPAGQV